MILKGVMILDKKYEMKVSKTMSYILRHNPYEFNLEVDDNGFVDFEKLVYSLKKTYKNISSEDVIFIVNNDDNKRYEISKDKTKIRAIYGHTFDFKIEKKECVPPAILFHGTNIDAWNNIVKNGYLKKMQRQYVFLSSEEEKAERVAVRRKNKQYVILKIDTVLAIKEGIKFYRESNGIYMSDDIPVKFINIHKFLN